MKRFVLTVAVLFALTTQTSAQGLASRSKPACPPDCRSTKLASPKPIPALPWWGDPAYPIIHQSKEMHPLQIMAFGLRPAVLTEDWKALNWYENQGGFHLDTLPAGTIVLIDQFGHPQYKLDCSNRLVSDSAWFVHWPSTTTVLPTTGPTTTLPTTSLRRLDNWFSRFFNRIGSFFN